MNYEIIDSGNGKILEKVNDLILIRPFSNAIWDPKLSTNIWSKAHAEFQGYLDKGNGKWIFHKKFDKNFNFKYKNITFKCKFSDYAHIGVFFEQQHNWKWLEKNIKSNKKYLNLFAYTGGSSLIIAKKANVTHVDASKSVVKWAKQNAELSSIKHNSIRWIIDDALKFVLREHKRNSFYDGIIMDPPTFGRGSNGEIWKIEKDLIKLISNCNNILKKDAHLFLLSTHTPGITNQVLFNCLQDIFPNKDIESGDLLINEKNSHRQIYLGSFARFS